MPRMLSIGSTGPDVTRLQGLLNSRPPSALPRLNVDGIFGPKTLARVKEFQRNHGLQADGIVGPKTWGKLEESPPTPTVIKSRTGIACGNDNPGNLGQAAAFRHALVSSVSSSSFVPASFTLAAFPASRAFPASLRCRC
jgi:peptidoglycan hydrolase-like protein with peptidoglycan-binding domain